MSLFVLGRCVFMALFNGLISSVCITLVSGLELGSGNRCLKPPFHLFIKPNASQLLHKNKLRATKRSPYKKCFPKFANCNSRTVPFQNLQ